MVVPVHVQLSDQSQQLYPQPEVDSIPSVIVTDAGIITTVYKANVESGAILFLSFTAFHPVPTPTAAPSPASATPKPSPPNPSAPQWSTADHDPQASRYTAAAGFGLPLPQFINVGPSMYNCDDSLTSPPPQPVVAADGTAWLACASSMTVRHVNMSDGSLLCGFTASGPYAGDNVTHLAVTTDGVLVMSQHLLFRYSFECALVWYGGYPLAVPSSTFTLDTAGGVAVTLRDTRLEAMVLHDSSIAWTMTLTRGGDSVLYDDVDNIYVYDTKGAGMAAYSASHSGSQVGVGGAHSAFSGCIAVTVNAWCCVVAGVECDVCRGVDGCPRSVVTGYDGRREWCKGMLCGVIVVCGVAVHCQT